MDANTICNARNVAKLNAVIFSDGVAMNERIEELAKQAGAGEWGDSVIPAMMDIERFAELIVRECADIAKTAAPYRSEDLILKRFGFDDE
jgi:hypothetical protein